MAQQEEEGDYSTYNNTFIHGYLLVVVLPMSNIRLLLLASTQSMPLSLNSPL